MTVKYDWKKLIQQRIKEVQEGVGNERTNVSNTGEAVFETKENTQRGIE